MTLITEYLIENKLKIKNDFIFMIGDYLCFLDKYCQINLYENKLNK